MCVRHPEFLESLPLGSLSEDDVISFVSPILERHRGAAALQYVSTSTKGYEQLEMLSKVHIKKLAFCKIQLLLFFIILSHLRSRDGVFTGSVF